MSKLSFNKNNHVDKNIVKIKCILNTVVQVTIIGPTQKNKSKIEKANLITETATLKNAGGKTLGVI